MVDAWGKKEREICTCFFYTYFSREEWLELLNLVLKTGDRIQIGDDVVIKLQSDSRAQLAIDAPREVSIKRLAAEPKAPKSVKSSDKV